MNKGDRGHEIATASAGEFLRAATAAGLPWTEIAVACESFVVMVVCYCASMTEAPNPSVFAQEVIESMTERAHVRAQAHIRGIEYDGA